jgi:hypothetical protein
MDNEKKTEVLELAHWQATCADDCWSRHPEHTLSSWQHEVFCNYTRQGYREWVESRIIENHFEG